MTNSRKKSKRSSGDKAAVLELRQDFEILWRLEEVNRLVSTVRLSSHGICGFAVPISSNGSRQQRSDALDAKKTMKIVS